MKKMKIKEWMYNVVYIILYCVFALISFIYFGNYADKYSEIHPNLVGISALLYVIGSIALFIFVIYDLV